MTIPPPIDESRVVLHDAGDLDADLTLQRGRVLLSNEGNKPLRARVRVENTTNPEHREVWDLTLDGPGTEVLVEVWRLYPPDEPFYPNPKDPGRKGPTTRLDLLVRKGSVNLTHGDKTERVDAPPGPALLIWDSYHGSNERRTIKAVPDWAADNPPSLSPDIPVRLRTRMEKARAELVKARDGIVSALRAQPDGVEATLSGLLKDTSKPAERLLVLRSFGALDDLTDLVDALGNEEKPGVPADAVATLRAWIADGPDNDYKLVDALKKGGYTAIEADNILKLLHYLTPQEAARRETYQYLILNLTNRRIALRQLASSQLYFLAESVAAGIPYSPSDPPRQREAAQQRWLRVLQAGGLPPRPRGAPDGKRKEKSPS
jgi:hypothetical protein